MNIIDLDGIVIVTGTDTDAGKTVTTAVIAAALKQAGKDVLIIKPYQTGLAPEEPGDVHEAGRLSGVDADNLLEYVRCPEPLAPTTSAARAGMTIPSDLDISRETGVSKATVSRLFRKLDFADGETPIREAFSA